MKLSTTLKEAKYYKKLSDNEVRCLLCPKLCRIKDGENGYCSIRKNISGTLYAIAYNSAAAIHMDPIEKKPLYHFYPGSEILSLGTVGCNQRCLFCQNWSLVEGEIPEPNITPEDAIESAKRLNSIGIAYTYNEPLIWFEFVLDTAKIAKREGLKNVLVTNGEINPHPLKELLPYIDAMNIDLKSINKEFYKNICDGNLNTVKKTIETSFRVCHIEVTNLLVTEKNDSDEDIKSLVDYVASLSKDIPLHFSRYFPQYKMDAPPTPIDKLFRAYEIGRKKLKYVYLGNVWSEEESNTYCPDCNNLLIKRAGYATKIMGLSGKKCSKCGNEINIIL